jgi:tRNA G10  N-methylase Trm11
VNNFYATFIPGLQDLIAETVKQRLSGVKIHKLLDGAVLFETETSYDKLNFFCFNNIFAIVSIMEYAEGSTSLEKHTKSAINGSGAEEVIANNSGKIKSFRVVFSRENVPAAVDERLRLEAEKYISRVGALKIDRSLPDTEFWFLFRREDEHGGKNFSVFMKRLTLRPSWEKSLHKGELPPPLAWALCRIARLSHGETVLDPFCGYGSIPQAALKHFHVTKFIACDSDKKAASYTAAGFKERNCGDFILHHCDFYSLPSLVAEKNIDAIVTDPPWGHYREIDGNAFYAKMFTVFEKLLKDGGRAVVLCANKEELLKAVPGCFNLENSVPILLSGKKTVIFEFILKNNY